MPDKKSIIYFHVGLGKTASTYLQHRVFPHLKNIKYIPTNQYKKSLQLINTSSATRFLISREFDRQFEDEVSWFCETHPDAHIIVVFRRHDKWIASQYRRHVKGGFYKEFKDFIDVQDNKGFWDKKELIFMDKIKVIEKYSTKKPLILFHEEMAEDPKKFIQEIVTFCGATIDLDTISLRPKHTAWSDKQLLAIKAFRKRFAKKEIKGGSNRLETWLYYRPWWILFHIVMYMAKFLPEKWLSSKPLIKQQDLDDVKNFMKDDWELLVTYAGKNSIKTTSGYK